MTVSELVLDEWATQPLGKAARAAIAIGGSVTATLVLVMASMLPGNAWVIVAIGVALAATSVRAARYPTLLRLGTVAANLVAIPLLMQII